MLQEGEVQTGAGADPLVPLTLTTVGNYYTKTTHIMSDVITLGLSQ